MDFLVHNCLRDSWAWNFKTIDYCKYHNLLETWIISILLLFENLTTIVTRNINNWKYYFGVFSVFSILLLVEVECPSFNEYIPTSIIIWLIAADSIFNRDFILNSSSILIIQVLCNLILLNYALLSNIDSCLLIIY